MVDIKEAVTKKVGPLPVWAYAAIAAGAIYLWMYLRGGSASGSTGTGMEFPAEGTSDSSIWDEAGANPSGVGGGGGPLGGASTPTTNQAWLLLSAQYLIGFSYDGVTVNNALTKYLTGLSLTTPERALVAQAIARYGVPPEGIPPSSGGDAPTPGPPGTPAPPPRVPIAVSPIASRPVPTGTVVSGR